MARRGGGPLHQELAHGHKLVQAVGNHVLVPMMPGMSHQGMMDSSDQVDMLHRVGVAVEACDGAGFVLPDVGEARSGQMLARFGRVASHARLERPCASRGVA